jgi:hypothetical protein
VQVKLADLCALVLNKKLPKPEITRVSNHWDNDVLTEAQQEYAALDAWVSLEMFNTLLNHQVIGSKLNEVVPGTIVGVYPGSSYQDCAFGRLANEEESETELKKFVERKGKGHRSKTKTYDVVEIVKVKTSGMITQCHTDPISGRYLTLDDIGSTPFYVVLNKDTLKVASGLDLSNDYTVDERPGSSLLPTEGNTEQADEHTEGGGDALPEEMEDDVIRVNDNSLAFCGSFLLEKDQQLRDENDAISNVYLTRVKKDIFHLIDMIRVSLRHRISKEFKRRYRDALFMVDSDDKKLVTEYLARNGSSWDECLLERPGWLLQRVRRYVPQPHILYPLLKEVFYIYGDSLCDRTGGKLFDGSAKKAAKNVLETIRMGHISDPIGIPLYYKVTDDANGLPIYRCPRGTDGVEGGVHTNIIKKFGSHNASPELADACLADYRLSHNINVGILETNIS